MGHDIYAYRKGEEDSSAYLRRSAFNQDRHTIYELLGAQKFDNDCSGNGEAKYFNGDDLMGAIEWLKTHPLANVKEQHRDTLEFLEKSLLIAKEEGRVRIRFA